MSWEQLFEMLQWTDPTSMERLMARFPEGPDSLSDDEWTRFIPGVDRRSVTPQGGGGGNNMGLEGATEFSGGQEEKWRDYTDATRQSLAAYQKGINVPAETGIAYGQQASARQDEGNLALRGTARGGASLLLGQQRQNAGTMALSQSRTNTQQMGIAGNLQLSGQYASLLQGGMGLYGSALASSRGGQPWKSEPDNQKQKGAPIPGDQWSYGY